MAAYWTASFPGGARDSGDVFALSFSAVYATSRTIPVPGVSPSLVFDSLFSTSSGSNWFLNLGLVGGGAPSQASLPLGTIITVGSETGGTPIDLVVDNDSWSTNSVRWQWTQSGFVHGSGDITLAFTAPGVAFEFDPDSATVVLTTDATGTVNLYTVAAPEISGEGDNVYSIVGTPQQGISIDSATGVVSFNASTANVNALPAAGNSFTVQVSAANDTGNTANRFTLTVQVRAADLIPMFGMATVPARSFERGQAIAPFTLPAATSGDPPLTYTVVPALPDGLMLSGRQVSGTPTTIQAQRTYEWTVTDVDGDTDTLDFNLTITGPAPAAGSSWREPRTWEGRASDGDRADKLGEWDSGRTYGSKIAYNPNNNIYDLTFEWSEPLNETAPAIARTAGQMFVADGRNSLDVLDIGSGEGRAYRAGTSTVVIEAADTTLNEAYPTTTRGDLVRGNASGEPSRFAAPTNTAPRALFAMSNAVQWVTMAVANTFMKQHLPTTTRGDLVTGNASGAPGRLAAPTNTAPRALFARGNAPEWITLSAANTFLKQHYPTTTEGDLVVGGNDGSPERLEMPSAFSLLTSDGTDVSWDRY